MNAMRLSPATLLLLAIAGIAGCGTQSIVTTNPPANADFINAPDTSLPYHKTFKYTGKLQSFVVPAHVTSLNVDVRGAAGGGTTSSSVDYFGRGGRIFAIIPVHPQEELYVFVGGEGSTKRGGFNGGGNPGAGGDGSYGGGGASDLRTRLSIRDRIVVGAGGGGEGSYSTQTGGNGGGKVGGAGGSYCYTNGCRGNGGGGGGGTQTAGGAGGAGGVGDAGGSAGGAGTLGSGGNGGAAGCTSYSSRCLCSYYTGCPGAGGGGGYYGGGGGGGAASNSAATYGFVSGGGGGGSSWAEARAVNVKTWSGWYKATENGLIVINWR